MDEPDEKKRGSKIPANWITVNPDEPLFEVRHTCVLLSELRDMAEKADEGGEQEE